MTTPIRIGLLRLVDSAPVVVADALGFFADLGLEVELSVEPSWANTMDKLGYGLLDAAVMLPPLALAAALGLRGPKVDLIVPMGLTQGGNAIVVGAGFRPIPNRRASASCTGFPPITCCCVTGWRWAGPIRIVTSKPWWCRRNKWSPHCATGA